MPTGEYPLFYVFHFYLFGIIAVASALAFVTRKSPVAAALWLVNTMIAFRRVNTPTTPIMNRTALKKSDSASIGTPSPLAQHHRAHHGGEQQDAGVLEGQEVLVEQRSRDRRDRPLRPHLLGDRPLG